MALVMIGGRYLLGEREPWVLLVALLGIGAITFIGALWIFDRGLMRDVLGFARQAIPRRRRPPPGSG